MPEPNCASKIEPVVVRAPMREPLRHSMDLLRQDDFLYE